MGNWVGAFMFSGNRETYVKLSLTFKTFPWRIYNLAHGRKITNVKDVEILKELESRGVIKGIRPW